MKRLFLLAFLVFAVVSIASAKGTADKITITTPDGQTFDVTDSRITEHLSMAALENFPNSIAEPKVTGNGYELARAYKDGDTYRIFDRARYYPAGTSGYVFYIGLNTGLSEYDGKWFEASQGGVEAMNKVIENLKPRTLRGRLKVWLD
jgi:hypothetical protein